MSKKSGAKTESARKDIGKKMTSSQENEASSKADERSTLPMTEQNTSRREKNARKPYLIVFICIISIICLLVILFAVGMCGYIILQTVKQEASIDKISVCLLAILISSCLIINAIFVFLTLLFARQDRWEEHQRNNIIIMDGSSTTSHVIETDKSCEDSEEINNKELYKSLDTKLSSVLTTLELLQINLPSEGNSYDYLMRVRQILAIAEQYQIDNQMSSDNLIVAFNNIKASVRNALDVAQECIDTRKRK